MVKHFGAVPNNFNHRVVHAASAMIFALILGATYGATAQSSAEGVPNAMQGFSQNRERPIQIEAATLEMRDKKKEATFSGGVKVVQGDTTMTSKTLVVFYESSPAPVASAPTKTKGAAKTAPLQSATPGPGGSSSIKRLEAHGDVRVTQKDQVVTGEAAVFDTKTNLITMLGGRSDPVQECTARRSPAGRHDDGCFSDRIRSRKGPGLVPSVFWVGLRYAVGSARFFHAGLKKITCINHL
jgi:lipopolysaccharide export system protein LptA